MDAFEFTKPGLLRELLHGRKRFGMIVVSHMLVNLLHLRVIHVHPGVPTDRQQALQIVLWSSPSRVKMS